MNEEWRNEFITKGAAVDAIMERDQYAEPMECVDAIKALPSTQPEIIRCKDCVWRDGSICRNNDTMPWSDDDFCSNAERRQDGKTD